MKVIHNIQVAIISVLTWSDLIIAVSKMYYNFIMNVRKLYEIYDDPKNIELRFKIAFGISMILAVLMFIVYKLI